MGCLFGHKLELAEHVQVSATKWHRTDRFGQPRPGTEYVRTKTVKIYKCRRCKFSKGELWIDNPDEFLDELTVAYAYKLIKEAK